MKALQNLQNSFLVILLLSLSSCALMTTPESNLERLSYLEISYGVILDKATLYANEGRLDDAQKAAFSAAFDTYEESRNLARLAIYAADDDAFDTQAAAMTTVLTVLRSTISEIEQP
jgi:phospholipase C